MTPLEMFAAEVADDDVHEVIRPAAVLPETAARQVIVELAHHDVRADGCWATSPTLRQRYDRPGNGGVSGAPDDALLLGSVQVSYGLPTPYAITMFGGTLSPVGVANGWTVEVLCDEAVAFGGYTLAGCPRVALAPHTRVAPA